MAVATETVADTSMADTSMADKGPDPVSSEPVELVLSADEKRVLALYDQLKALQLQTALLRARESYKGTDTDTDLATAQQKLLEARADYVLRTEVVDSVLTVHPVLRAVHHAIQASPIERDLLAAVAKRDTVSQTVAREATARRALRDEQAKVAAECRTVEAANVALAAELRRLTAEQEGLAGAAAADDDDSDDELAQLKASVKESRQRWKLIKGTASAIVAGSGVDWVRDAALRDIVLDPE